jgi:hypothetical protein
MENIQSKLRFSGPCAFIWFKNIEKMLLQITSGFLQLKSTIGHVLFIYRTTSDFNFIEIIIKVQL